ncbi:MAG: CRISPR-associated ring nuclease Csm6 [Xanthomonadales bacterium]|nr:CRISPR-associated ring nuclease Csm6 [Xanthomonadales bacterium]
MPRILLCVTGLSPQIVTETIYALAVRPPAAREPWVPDEVHLITTTRGSENARLQLLRPGAGWFHRLIADYGLPDIRFGEDHIHLITRPDGTPLEDIRDDEDNRLAADAIADRVRRLTASEANEIHASIAGGRKTMGFFLGYAMSLYGRPQDRLSHVLVSAPFESSPDFFYPTPQPHLVRRGDQPKEVADASRAQVWLGDIPFVRLRRELDPDSLNRTDGAFADAVRSVQERLAESRMVIDVARREVRIGRHAIRLPPADLALLLWVAERDRSGRPVAPQKSEGPEARADASEYLAQYARLLDDPDERETRTHARLSGEGLIRSFFQERAARLRQAFRRELGAGRAQAFLVVREGSRGRPQYRLAVPPERVEVIR